MYFSQETPDEVCQLLVRLNQSRERVKIRLGDPETGRDWNEEWDTIGTIGRSTGTQKIPLLIQTTRSLGGGAISDSKVLKVTNAKTGKVLYKHPKYQERKIDIVDGDMPEYPYNTTIDGVLHGRHKSIRSAKITVNRLT